MTTYRIEQRSREGQILRAEWVDEDGTPYSLRQALQDVDHMRAISPNFEWRVSGADGELVDEIAALDATDPDRIANRWLRAKIADDDSVKLNSGEEIATCLRLVADRLADIGPIVPTFLSLQLQATEFEPDEVARRATVDAIAARLGFAAGPHRLVGGFWHYSLRAARAVGAFTSMKAPETVDEPETPELVDGRENPETGDPVPDGVEGHPVGRVVEQTARAALDPNSLPGEDGSLDAAAARDAAAIEKAQALHEKRCPCGQPWALIISGNAKHTDECPERYAPEAGETEDALTESEGTR